MTGSHFGSWGAGMGVFAVVTQACVGLGDVGMGVFIMFGPLGLLVAAIIGAATGATVTQMALGQGSSFWKALLGAVVGFLTGGLLVTLCVLVLYYVGPWDDGWWPIIVASAAVCAPISTGAVIGSGWKAKPANLGIKEGVPPALN
jgi:hypothetical protein